MEEERVYGTLYIVGKEGSRLPFTIDKKSILLGRDPSCDIRIVNKEISRKHAEVYVDDETGACFINSMGREPVRVNGKPVESPQELFTGDHIEVLLEGRTREFVFEGEDDTVEVQQARKPLGQVTNSNNKAAVPAKAAPGGKPGAPPPPPPPPPPRGGSRPGGGAPPPPPPAARKPEAAPSGGMPSALQDAIKAGIKLKKVQPDDKPAPKAPAAPAAFVPNPADLLKLRAGLRKTDKSSTEAQKQEGEAPQIMQQAAPAAAEGSPGMPAKEPAAEEVQAAVPAKQPAAQDVAVPAQEPAAAQESPALETQQDQPGATDAAGQATPEEDPAAEVVQEPAAVEKATTAEEPAPAGGAAIGEEPASTEEAAPADELAQAGEAAPVEKLAAMTEQEMPAATEEGTDPMDTTEGEQQPPQGEAAMGAEAAEAAGVANELAASAVQPPTARKRVRFVESEVATPDGMAQDATMTIHLRKGDMRQVVNVDADNTVAFSQWALGSLEEEVEGQLPATVTVKKSRRESSLTAPSSAGKTPMHSALRSLFGDHTMTVRLSPLPDSAGKNPTPAGVLAPAPTPVTEAKAERPARDTSVIDATTLAAKLLELAKENDVTLELPADAAASVGKEAFKVVLTPRSTSKHGGGNTPASAPKAGPSTAGKSRLSQMGAAAEEEAVTELSFKTEAVEEESTPVLAPASVRQPARQTPRTGQKQPQPALEEGAVAAPASALRSTSRTPRVVIIERSSTPGTAARKSAQKSAAKSAQKPAAGGAAGEEEEAAPSPAVARGTQTTPRQLSTVGMQTLGEDSGEDVEQQPAQEEAGGDSMDIEEEEAPATVPLKLYQKTLLKAKAYRTQAVQLQAQLRKMAGKVTKLTKAATMVGQALEEERAKRLELQAAMQQIIINREAAAEAAAEEQEEPKEAEEAAAEAVPMEEEAEEEGCEEAEEEQPAPYVPKVVVVRPAGYLSPAMENRTERAGCVVVVRPQQAAAAAPAPAAESATASKAPATTPRAVVVASARKTPARRVSVAPEPPTAAKAQTSGGRTPAPPKSILKTAGKSAVVDKLVAKLVVDQVQLPDWLFEGQGAEGASADEGTAAAEAAAAELAAAVEDATAVLGEQAATAEAQQEGEQNEEAAAAMEVDAATEQAVAGAVAAPAHSLPQTQVMEVDVEVHQIKQTEPAAEESEDEEDEGEDDVCYLCSRSEEGDVLLLCDSCDNACHLTCCNPPLKRVPKGDWFCMECAAKQAPAAEVGRSSKKPAKQEAPAPEPATRGSKRSASTAAAEEEEPATQQAGAAPKPGRGRRASVVPIVSHQAAAAAAAAAEDAEEVEQEDPKPSRSSRRASVAPVSAQAALSQEAEQPAAKPARGRRASVAPPPSQLAAPEEVEVEQKVPAAKPARGRRASVAAAPAQAAGAKRGRGAAALDAIVEEGSEGGQEQAAEEAAPKSKRPRAARGAKQEEAAEPANTNTRTTRATRGSKQEDHEVEGPASRRGRAKAEPAAAPKATRTTRGKR